MAVLIANPSSCPYILQADTSRVIWAHHPRDPTNENAIPRHSAMGSASLNLLGGLTVDRVEPDAADFSVLVDNVSSKLYADDQLIQTVFLYSY